MIFQIDDPVLAFEVRRVIDEFNRKNAEAASIASMSYPDRMASFLARFYMQDELVGRIDWYKDIPLFATFPPQELEKFFCKGEPVPCLMRGSISMMKKRRSPMYSLACDVLRRFIRSKKYNCTNSDEWVELCRSYAGDAVINRIREKWDSSGKHNFYTFALTLVSREYYGGVRSVLIEGEKSYFSAEKIKLLDALRAQESKLKKLEVTFAKLTDKRSPD
jgi:hypothetical protein